jgi:hypothetical protein
MKIKLNSYLPTLTKVIENQKERIKAFSVLYQSICESNTKELENLENSELHLIEHYQK